ncbi:MAG TPA: hypothetical protein VIU43_04525 [Nitrosospira sp.]
MDIFIDFNGKLTDEFCLKTVHQAQKQWWSMEFLSQNSRKKGCGDQYGRPFKQNGALSGLFMAEPVKDI